MDPNTNPKTGWPLAFEAALRLGGVAQQFCLFVDKDDTVWCCVLIRRRGRAYGRGSQGKRKLCVWWKKLAPIKAGSDYVKTDWFTQDARLDRALLVGCDVHYHDKLAPHVNIVGIHDDPQSRRERNSRNV